MTTRPIRLWLHRSWGCHAAAVDVCEDDAPYRAIARWYEFKLGRAVLSVHVPCTPRTSKRGWMVQP